jgi:hypothetical protein
MSSMTARSTRWLGRPSCSVASRQAFPRQRLDDRRGHLCWRHPDRRSVALAGGEFICKRFRRRGDADWLVPENPAYRPLRITEGMQFEIFSVVTYAVHDPNRR